MVNIRRRNVTFFEGQKGESSEGEFEYSHTPKKKPALQATSIKPTLIFSQITRF